MKNLKSYRAKTFAASMIAAGALAVSGGAASAATFEWAGVNNGAVEVGDLSTLWNNFALWAPWGVPGRGDDVILGDRGYWFPQTDPDPDVAYPSTFSRHIETLRFGTNVDTFRGGGFNRNGEHVLNIGPNQTLWLDAGRLSVDEGQKVTINGNIGFEQRGTVTLGDAVELIIKGDVRGEGFTLDIGGNYYDPQFPSTVQVGRNNGEPTNLDFGAGVQINRGKMLVYTNTVDGVHVVGNGSSDTRFRRADSTLEWRYGGDSNSSFIVKQDGWLRLALGTVSPTNETARVGDITLEGGVLQDNESTVPVLYRVNSLTGVLTRDSQNATAVRSGIVNRVNTKVGGTSGVITVTNPALSGISAAGLETPALILQRAVQGGNVAVRGGGILEMSTNGTNAAENNSFSSFSIESGTVLLNRNVSGMGNLVSNNVRIGNNTAAAKLENRRANQISDFATVTLNRQGTWDLNGFTEKVAGLHFDGGQTQTGTIQLGDTGSTVTSRGGTVISTLNLLADRRYFDVASGGTLDLIGAVNNGSLTLTGPGTVRFGDVNGMTPQHNSLSIVEVQGGTLILDRNVANGNLVGQLIRVGVGTDPGQLINARNEQIGNNSIVGLVGPSSTWDLLGNTETIGSTSFLGGTIKRGLVKLNGPNSSIVTDAGGRFEADIDLLNREHTFDLTKGGLLTLSGNIANGSLAFNGEGTTSIGGGTAYLSGNNTYAGGTTVTRGTDGDVTVKIKDSASLGSGPLKLDGGILQIVNPITMSQPIQLISSGTIDTLNHELTTLASISGSASDGGLTKLGTGALVAKGDLTYTGPTSIQTGTLAMFNSTVGNSSGIDVNAGATFDISGANNVLIKELSGAGALKLGENILGINQISDSTFGGGFTEGGKYGGTGGGVTKRGAGTLTVEGVSNYTGATRIEGGTLAFTNANPGIGNSSGIFVGSGAKLDITNTPNGATITGLSGSGTVLHGDRTLRIATAAGTYSEFNGLLSGTGGGTIIKRGDGTLALNRQFGQFNLSDVRLEDGTLLIGNQFGAGTGYGNLVINGGTLAGTGQFAPSAGNDVTLTSGVISPGNSPGTLTFKFGTGSYLNLDGGTLDFELGTSQDLIVFTNLGDQARGTGTTLELSLREGFSYANTYTLFANVLESGTFSFAGVTGISPGYQADVFHNDGLNAYQISFAAVPEPTTLGMLGLGGMILATRRRRVA